MHSKHERSKLFYFESVTKTEREICRYAGNLCAQTAETEKKKKNNRRSCRSKRSVFGDGIHFFLQSFLIRVAQSFQLALKLIYRHLYLSVHSRFLN